MAAIIKLSLFVIALIAMVNSQRVVDVPKDMPPNLPWIPQWVDCEFDFETFKNGPTCNDCYTTYYCTPKGGILRNCFGWSPYCVDGKCVKEPSADCAVAETVTDVY
ncbi:uncharacterized protein LOC125231115 [Leguminivora glycinivorella]|uniref:uncharacterized protein LOC125231115 n=1 Tax=Leguminivora glycinivorella TaxID=1035111 RepID=UPI00200E43BA|nr:uncharacterized protein LOC125231115 [Leguminivora glycinivorella]